MEAKETRYWFPKVLAPRMMDAINKRSFMGARVTCTVHEDGDMAMIEYTLGMNLTEDRTDTAHKMICMFIMGFEEGAKK